MGSLTKVIFLLFLIDMSLYLFSDYIGNQNILIYEEDLFKKVVHPENLSQGDLMVNASQSTLVRDEVTDTSFLNIFDRLKNIWVPFDNFFKTVVNIFGAPFVLMTSLSDLGTPKPILIILFGSMAMLLILGILKLFGGHDV